MSKLIELTNQIEDQGESQITRSGKLSGYLEVIKDCSKMVLFLAMLWVGYQGYLSMVGLLEAQKLKLTDYLIFQVLSDRSFGLDKKGNLITPGSLDTVEEYKAALAATIRDNEDLVTDLETVRLALAAYDGKFNRGEIQIDKEK